MSNLLARLNPLNLFKRGSALPAPRFPGFSGISILGGTGPLETQPIRGRRAQMEAYAGWAYAAVSTLSQDVRAQPWNLWIRTSSRRNEWKKLERGPVFNILSRPNAQQAFGDFIELHQIHLDLTGEPFWHIITDRKTPIGIQPIYPHWVEEPVIQDGRLIAWRVQVPGYSQSTIAAEDIVTPFYPHPLEPLRGASPVEAYALSYSLDLYARAYGAGLLANRARPDVIVSSDQELSEPHAEAIRTRWKERYRVPGEVAVLGKGAKVQTLSLNLKDLEFMSVAQLTREQILAIYKVPPSKLGISEQGASRANAETFSNSYNENALFPRLLRIQDALNTWVLPRLAQAYGYRRDELWFEYESPVKEDAKFKLEQANAGLDRAAVNIDQWREAQGLEPLPNQQGQFFLIPNTHRVVASLAEAAQLDSGQNQSQPPSAQPTEDPAQLNSLIARAVEEGFTRAQVLVQRDREERDLVGRIRALLSREQKAVMSALNQENTGDSALVLFDGWKEEGIENHGWLERLKVLKNLESNQIAQQYDQWKGDHARQMARQILGEKHGA